ncbi:hypothetical protein EA462_03540 [Natrarchaeobius halalkaliphilus]|uniref:Uncharacterized protein n=1 Tax=Natrarchaeobius halalkaliphilus TaxID=1679091 RepID=A0A3N6LRN8_9EURY|nr:hypothetical protein [Natrarchaeobius halalkaliphilus]RQG91087.1 hypothetical protein EA462_03540 [Natrarchaeobius halalkaliphilus]
MTSIRDLLADRVGVGETYRLTLTERDGTLVAVHPDDDSPMDVAVVEGLESITRRPPPQPVTVEILDRVVDGRVAGKIVDADAD